LCFPQSGEWIDLNQFSIPLIKEITMNIQTYIKHPHKSGSIMKLLGVFICFLIIIFIISISTVEIPKINPKIFYYGLPNNRVIDAHGTKQVFFYHGGFPMGDSTFTFYGKLLAVNHYYCQGSWNDYGGFEVRADNFEVETEYYTIGGHLRVYGLPWLYLISLILFIILFYIIVKDYKRIKKYS